MTECWPISRRTEFCGSQVLASLMRCRPALYEACAGFVRVTSVASGSPTRQIGCMAQYTPVATGETFDELVLPHLDAGFRLARWIVRNDHDAEDVVQEASLRAFRYFRTFT